MNIRSGTILVEFLEPIPAGLPREDFHRRMQDDIEAASDRLLAEGLDALGPRAPRIAPREAPETAN